MPKILFVSNGHGEESIAARIADEVIALMPDLAIDHLALVGDFGHPSVMHDVGPRRTMPSGGLIAMGNVRNIARDVRKGLLTFTFEQARFLRGLRRSGGSSGSPVSAGYDLVVAIGDTFSLLMAMQTKAPAIFVGTAKSVHVAPYGPFEERIFRRARAVFVRDRETAERLRAHGVDAQAPGNVIVDLFAMEDDVRADDAVNGFIPALAVFPGSRQTAYLEASALTRVIRELSRARPHLGAALSIAPGLETAQFMQVFTEDGWTVRQRDDIHIPFTLCIGEREVVRAWHGQIGALLSRVTLVLGQAGTANEAAAAAGVPIVALELATDRSAWYRKRQCDLLGDALLLAPENAIEAAQRVAELLDDPHRLGRMSMAGRERMGHPGGAHAIARCIVLLLQESDSREEIP